MQPSPYSRAPSSVHFLYTLPGGPTQSQNNEHLLTARQRFTPQPVPETATPTCCLTSLSSKERSQTGMDSVSHRPPALQLCSLPMPSGLQLGSCLVLISRGTLLSHPCTLLSLPHDMQYTCVLFLQPHSRKPPLKPLPVSSGHSKGFSPWP